jgi:hypothetical protein
MSLGGGRFSVEDDSLHTATGAKSEYIRRDAIERGTVIVIGRKTSDAGAESLEPRVKADVPLYFDDDTSTPSITAAAYPVANVVVDGISARNIEHIEMV